MPRTARRILMAAILMGLTVGLGTLGVCMAAPRQVPLTQEVIDNLIAVQRETSKTAEQLPKSDGNFLQEARQGLAIARKMEAFEKAHGFKDANEFEAVLASVQNVQNGIDPETKRYDGPAYLKKAIADLDAEKAVPAETKEPLLKLYRDELKTMEAAGAPPPGNVELVVKNFDRLQQALTGGGTD